MNVARSAARAFCATCVVVSMTLAAPASHASSPVPGFPVIGSVSVGSGPRDLALSTDGKRLFVAGDSRSVSVVDTESMTLMKQVTLGEGPGGIMSISSPTWFDGVVVFGFLQGGFIQFLDRDTLDVVRVLQTDPPYGVAVHPFKPIVYFISQRKPSVVQVLDGNSGTVIGEIDRGDNSAIFTKFRISDDGTELSWIRGDQRVVVSTETLSLLRTEAHTLDDLMMPESRQFTTRDGRYDVFLTNEGIAVRDIKNPKRRIATSRTPSIVWLVPDPSGLAMWGVSSQQNTVVKYDLAPSRPGRLFAVAKGVPGGATVTWTSRDKGWTPGMGRVTAVAQPGGKSCTSEGSACTIAGLDRGRRYTVRVQAENIAGKGPVARTSVRVPDVKPPRRPVRPQPPAPKPEQELS